MLRGRFLLFERAVPYANEPVPPENDISFFRASLCLGDRIKPPQKSAGQTYRLSFIKIRQRRMAASFVV
jgi:hypothetical protein